MSEHAFELLMFFIAGAAHGAAWLYLFCLWRVRTGRGDDPLFGEPDVRRQWMLAVSAELNRMQLRLATLEVEHGIDLRRERRN